MTTAESRCVVCGGRVEEYNVLIWPGQSGVAVKHGYHCTRCKLRYSEPPPKAYGLEDKVKIMEEG